MPPGTPRLVLSSAKTGLPFKTEVLGEVRSGGTVAYRAGSAFVLAIRACPLGRRTCAQLAVIPFLSRTSLAANNVTAVRLGLRGNRQSGTIATAAPSRRLFLGFDPPQEAFALARSRPSRRRWRRSRRRLARSAGCRSGGTGAVSDTNCGASSAAACWAGSDASGRTSINSSTTRPFAVIFQPPLMRSTKP
ncbi:hypothetical protein ACVW1A_004909 [Bradyrhizobium sp. LB1.3]